MWSFLELQPLLIILFLVFVMWSLTRERIWLLSVVVTCIIPHAWRTLSKPNFLQIPSAQSRSINYLSESSGRGTIKSRDLRRLCFCVLRWYFVNCTGTVYQSQTTKKYFLGLKNESHELPCMLYLLGRCTISLFWNCSGVCAVKNNSVTCLVTPTEVRDNNNNNSQFSWRSRYELTLNL